METEESAEQSPWPARKLLGKLFDGNAVTARVVCQSEAKGNDSEFRELVSVVLEWAARHEDDAKAMPKSAVEKSLRRAIYDSRIAGGPDAWAQVEAGKTKEGKRRRQRQRIGIDAASPQEEESELGAILATEFDNAVFKDWIRAGERERDREHISKVRAFVQADLATMPKLDAEVVKARFLSSHPETQRALAARLGVGQATIVRAEKRVKALFLARDDYEYARRPLRAYVLRSSLEGNVYLITDEFRRCARQAAESVLAGVLASDSPSRAVAYTSRRPVAGDNPVAVRRVGDPVPPSLRLPASQPEPKKVRGMQALPYLFARAA